MKVGDLVRVKYDGTTGIIARKEVMRNDRVRCASIWIHLHTGESFKPEYLEVINESR